MDAKDLMIGDFVLDKAVSDNPVQIEQINEQNVYYKHRKGYISVAVELLEPISLTKEILEKNGFSYDKTYKFAKITIANYYVLVWFDYDAKNIDYVQIKEQYNNKDVATSKLTNLYFTHIQNVHELQHAMRMVGLNDVIKTL